MFEKRLMFRFCLKRNKVGSFFLGYVTGYEVVVGFGLDCFYEVFFEVVIFGRGSFTLCVFRD